MEERLPEEGKSFKFDEIVNPDAGRARRAFEKFKDQFVKVERSSGVIEDGWRVVDVSGPNISVMRGEKVEESGSIKSVFKEIHIDEFEKLNS